ncbi:hypothetical protein F5051DRAFT_445053 [Lentinula edodes]|nr:hypothetical protein F5051DRAFT_445053 [Lentinula edodes]
MSLLHNTLFCLLLFGVRAYPQQTSSPTATVASSSTVTAVLSTIDLGGFNLGGETIPGFEQEFTTISVVGISSRTGSDGKSATTYSREIIISDAILTTATDGSLIPNTVVPGNVITEIKTFVENVSGYYVTDAETITTGSTYEIQGNYETCSFAGPGAVSAGCSDSDYLVEMPTDGGSTTTVYHSGQFSDPVSATTMTLPVQVVASPQALSSGSNSETTVKPQASGSGSDSGNTNDGVSLGIGGKYSMTRVCLLSFLAFLAGRM